MDLRGVGAESLGRDALFDVFCGYRRGIDGFVRSFGRLEVELVVGIVLIIITG